MIKIIPLQSNTRLRPTHSTAFQYISLYNPSDDIAADTIWTAAENDPETKQKTGDQWAHVISARGDQIEGWMAIIHNGIRISLVETDETMPPPIPDNSPPGLFPPEITIRIGNHERVYTLVP